MYRLPKETIEILKRYFPAFRLDLLRITEVREIPGHPRAGAAIDEVGSRYDVRIVTEFLSFESASGIARIAHEIQHLSDRNALNKSHGRREFMRRYRAQSEACRGKGYFCNEFEARAKDMADRVRDDLLEQHYPLGR